MQTEWKEYQESVSLNMFLKEFLKSLQRSTQVMGDRMGLIGFDNNVREEWVFKVNQKRLDILRKRTIGNSNKTKKFGCF